MSGAKEIRGKIASIKNTQKITKAMEMVAASKMRKAQDRMQETRPYAQKIQNVRETIPTPKVNGPDSGDLLVVAWGSTYGAIRSSVEAMQRDGVRIGRVHLRHIWPMPHGLPEIFAVTSGALHAFSALLSLASLVLSQGS